MSLLAEETVHLVCFCISSANTLSESIRAFETPAHRREREREREMADLIVPSQVASPVLTDRVFVRGKLHMIAIINNSYRLCFVCVISAL